MQENFLFLEKSSFFKPGEMVTEKGILQIMLFIL